MTTIQELKTFKLFHDLDDDELNKIAPLFQERSLNEGTICFLQGTPASELHLCRSGKVNIVVRHFEAPTIYVKIHTALEGEVFGWSALVEPYQYTASAICAEKTEEIYLRKADLFKLFDQVPRIGYVFMKNLAALVSSRVTDYGKRLSKDVALDTRNDYEW
ncbi:MAG: cyclic nucleotide-binding domain-containing protein [Deltaproteobacteria bacterium]|nr:cyclic nucleotide-binding domain-containing protein [Deltaproteobacteria bacterium]